MSNMYSFDNYLPIATFNDSTIFFKALEVFRYGFLIDSIEEVGEYRQLYSYHNYYVEIIYKENYEEIKDIMAMPISVALNKYVDEVEFDIAFRDLIAA